MKKNRRTLGTMGTGTGISRSFCKSITKVSVLDPHWLYAYPDPDPDTQIWQHRNTNFPTYFFWSSDLGNFLSFLGWFYSSESGSGSRSSLNADPIGIRIRNTDQGPALFLPFHRHSISTYIALGCSPCSFLFSDALFALVHRWAPMTNIWDLPPPPLSQAKLPSIPTVLRIRIDFMRVRIQLLNADPNVNFNEIKVHLPFLYQLRCFLYFLS
jgi:hypothetical protein